MSKHAPRRTRTRSIETLEARQVMSADPVTQLLGGSVQQHSVQESVDEPPALVHHQERAGDFWIDPWAEQDLDTLVGDIQQTLSSAHGSTGLIAARNDYGFIGTGQTVAVIDSGIAWDHYALGGGLGSSYRVVGGWDFTENDANPYDDGPSGSHGTHVAGIVGSDRSGTNGDGVAPGVDLVGLRVFDDAGAGYFSWVEDALRWVHQNRNSFENSITAVNLSLGSTWNSSSIPSWATLEDEFAQLESVGIFIAVSAGNAFTTYNAAGLSYPAASQYVVPVMSVDDSGGLSTFSQRHTRAIAAPGRQITSTVPDYVGNHNGVTDDFASFTGTSMAAPYVAGASVLLREAMQFVGRTNITQDVIYDHMMSTATSFFDTATSQTYKRLNLGNALNSLMPTDDYGSTAGTANNLGTLTTTREFAGLIGKVSDEDFFAFTAGATGTVSLSVEDTHRLQTVVTITGATATVANGTWSFDVVAGQSYTISLKTATGQGIGYFDAELALDAEEVEAPPPPPPSLVTVKTVVRGDGTVFSLDTENWLSVNGSRVWNNTGDFAIGGDGTIYWQSTNGYLQHRTSSGIWVTIDDDVSKFAVDNNGVVYSLDSEEWLRVNGNRAWNRTQDFELGANQTLYWQCTNGYLQQRLQNGRWETIDLNVTKFAVRDNGMVYSLGTDNRMKINGNVAWNNTQDFVFTSDQSLYWHCTNGVLQQLPNQAAWATLGIGVTKFAVSHDGAVYSLTSDQRVLVDGVQRWLNVSDIRTDNSGLLEVRRTDGSIQKIGGRFEVSRPTVAQSSISTNGGSAGATVMSSVAMLGAWTIDSEESGNVARTQLRSRYDSVLGNACSHSFGYRSASLAAFAGDSAMSLDDYAGNIPLQDFGSDAASELWEDFSQNDELGDANSTDLVNDDLASGNQVALRTAVDSIFTQIGG